MLLAIRSFVPTFIFLAGLVTVVSGQAGSVDPTFNPMPSKPLPSDTSFQQIVQPDGKVIVYNAPNMFVNGQLRRGVFRLNPDGSLDQTFTYNNEGGVAIRNAMLAPDGEIILAGSTSPNHAKMIRLNADGSLDNAFSVFSAASGPPELSAAWFTVQAVQPDGKVIAVKGSWLTLGPFGTGYSYEFARYNLDGTVDPTLGGVSLPGGHIVSTTAIVRLLPDGRFYLAVTSRNHLGGSLSISRRLADGTVDSTYTPFSTTFGGSTFISTEDLSVAVDGGLLATGVFVPTGIGFPPQQQVRKYLPSGASTGFNAPLVFSGSRIYQLPSGKVLYSASGGEASRPLMRLETDGSVDNTYILDPGITSIKNSWQIDSMNRTVFLAQTAAGPRFVRLLENGSIDPTFNPILSAVGNISAVAVQPDDKLIVGGLFSHMNGTPRSGFARLNADGSVDATFDPGTGFNVAPRRLLIQPDGKVIAVGDFSSYNGTTVGLVARINIDGTLDSTFSANVSGSFVGCVTVQSDGKTLIGGLFTQVNGVSRNGLARLESNGALDSTFNPTLGGNRYISGILVEQNGKIAIVGNFTGVNGADRNNFARLEANGTTDLSFNAGALPSTGQVRKQPDGKYITFPNGPTINRRHADGSLDTSFTSPTFKIGTDNGYIEDLLLGPDGTMLVAGEFNNLGGLSRGFITKLLANGTHDGSFLTTGANARVNSLASAQNGKVIATGIFDSIENVSRLGIARLNVPWVQRITPFDFDGDGRADITVYRPSNNVWYQLLGSNYQFSYTYFGASGDILTPADYDGDGKTDISIFRPSSGIWVYAGSASGGTQLVATWGQAGDIPLPSDFDGDGKADFIVYRPSTNFWYRLANGTFATSFVNFGAVNDKPVIGDFDGDGKSDPAVFRPSTGEWFYASSVNNGQHLRAAQWGLSTDQLVPADYDGDGKTDPAIYRDGLWAIYNSSNGSNTILTFGQTGDKPVAADYDGDGKADVAVFRPSDGTWYQLRSTSGFQAITFGTSGDIPAPNAFVR